MEKCRLSMHWVSMKPWGNQRDFNAWHQNYVPTLYAHMTKTHIPKWIFSSLHALNVMAVPLKDTKCFAVTSLITTWTVQSRKQEAEINICLTCKTDLAHEPKQKWGVILKLYQAYSHMPNFRKLSTTFEAQCHELHCALISKTKCLT